MIPRYIVICFLLMCSKQANAQEHTSAMVANITIQGPGGRSLLLTQGHNVSLAGDVENVYADIKVLKPDGKPVILKITPYFCDGTDMQSRTSEILNGKQMPPLQVWSKSGNYIALEVVERENDGSFDFRNPLLSTFDTRTGDIVEFRGPSSAMTIDGFAKWSESKPDTPLLRGAHGIEEGSLSK